jgi:hypothetical protein
LWLYLGALSLAGQDAELAGKGVGEDRERADESVSLAETDPAAGEEEDALSTSADAVESTLQESAEAKKGVFESFRTRRGYRWWTNSITSLDDKYGLRFSVDYNVLAQQATEALDERFGAAGEFRWTARWRMWGRGTGNSGSIALQIRHRHRYSSIPPSDLGESVGSLWPTTRGFNDARWEVTHAY